MASLFKCGSNYWLKYHADNKRKEITLLTATTACEVEFTQPTTALTRTAS